MASGEVHVSELLPVAYAALPGVLGGFVVWRRA
jgi:hypothetical protein